MYRTEGERPSDYIGSSNFLCEFATVAGEGSERTDERGDRRPIKVVLSKWRYTGAFISLSYV